MSAARLAIVVAASAVGAVTPFGGTPVAEPVAEQAFGKDATEIADALESLADDLLSAGRRAFEPLWRLPLHAPYRELIDSPIADLNNAGKAGTAGAITAALFLQRFVADTSAWAHLDIYAWNPEGRPGRAKGGEATGLRALLHAIEARFAH